MLQRNPKNKKPQRYEHWLELQPCTPKAGRAGGGVTWVPVIGNRRRTTGYLDFEGKGKESLEVDAAPTGSLSCSAYPQALVRSLRASPPTRGISSGPECLPLSAQYPKKIGAFHTFWGRGWGRGGRFQGSGGPGPGRGDPKPTRTQIGRGEGVTVRGPVSLSAMSYTGSTRDDRRRPKRLMGPSGADRSAACAPRPTEKNVEWASSRPKKETGRCLFPPRHSGAGRSSSPASASLRSPMHNAMPRPFLVPGDSEPSVFF